MPVKTAASAIVAERRRLVASLRCRGRTLHEVTGELEAIGKVNPKSGRPWSLATVHKDVEHVVAVWQAEASRDIGAWKAAQLAELAEVRRAAWQANDLPTVLRALKQEAELVGTEAARQVEARVLIEQVRADARAAGLDEDRAAEQARRLMRDEPRALRVVA